MERVASDPGLRQLIAASWSRGVPLSIFLGGEHVVVYQNNAAGHVVRSTSRPWSEDDRLAVMAYLAWESDLCPGCREALSETTQPEREYAYRATPPIRCHRCTASLLASERYQDHPQASALLIPIELKPPD